MKVSIKSWQTENLRCPDMEVDLTSNGKIPKVSLIQMPNGTAKSTLLELMKISLSGDPLKPSEVAEFQDPKTSPTKGFFELVLNLDDRSKKGDISLKLFFDFKNKSIKYQTNNSAFKDDNDTSSGVDNNYNPPNELRPYLQKQIIELFIMSGNKVERLMSESTGAIEAIEAFTGQFLLKELITDVNEFYKSQVGGKKGGHTDGAHKKARDLESSLSKHLEKLVVRLDDLKQQKKEADEQIAAAESKLDGLGSSDEQFQKATEDKKEARDSLISKTVSARNMMMNPFFVSDAFAQRMVQFKENLETLKLPSNTSSEFFLELANKSNDSCVCGTPLSDEMRSYLLAHKDDYLSAGYTSILNSVKGQIDTMNSSAQDYQNDDEWNDFEQAKSKFDRAETAFNRVMTLKAKDPTGRFKKAAEDLSTHTTVANRCEERIQILEKKHSAQDSKIIEKSVKNGDLTGVTSVDLCQKLLLKAEGDLAKIEGNLVLLNAKEKLVGILEDSYAESSKHITEEVMNIANKKLAVLTKNDPVTITSLERNIETNNGRDVSQGQSLATAYSFSTSLLERSKNQFPLLIDHPFEGLQAQTRKRVSKFIPEICHQFIGFIIDSEKTSTLWDQNDISKKTGFREIDDLDIDYKTIFRITDATRQLADAVPHNSKIETKNCIITSDEEYFDAFQFEEEEDN